jgi:hypothetical protein
MSSPGRLDEATTMSTSASPSSAPEFNIPIGKLPRLFPELTPILTRPDQDEAAARRLLLARLRASCVECGQAVTSEELARLAAGSAEKGPTDRVLIRLSQGNCTTLGCESSCYRVELDQQPGEDWQIIIAALERLSSGNQVSTRRWRSNPEERRAMRIRLLLGVCVLGLVLLIKYRRDGGRIPLLDAKPKYQVSPGATPLPP